MKRVSFYLLMQAGLALCILLMLLSGCVDKELNNPFDPNNGAQVIPAPTFSLASGTYNVEKVTTISCTMQGVTIRYTTDGSEPNTNSTVYTAPLGVTANATLKAKAYKDGWDPSATSSAAYQFQVRDPVIELPGGVFNNDILLEVLCPTLGAQIRYTLDGSEPTENSSLYQNPVNITLDTTIKAKAYKTGCIPSGTVSEVYSFNVASPVIKPAGGIYSSSQTVIINCVTSGATIRYTTNGLEPTESSMIYNNPIKIKINTILKVKAYKPGWNPSSVASEIYNLKVATPEFSPDIGYISPNDPITISCSTNGATIRYTTDGCEPSITSTPYTAPLHFSVDTILKAKAFKEDWFSSETVSAIYEISFCFVPAGSFIMGNTLGGAGNTNELPTHTVHLSSFYIGRSEITQTEWLSVTGINPASGYGVGEYYPVYNVSWYAILKYCNLRSIAEGLSPVYTIQGSTIPIDWGAVPTASSPTWDAAICNWNANGYRLPTEAEWEYAARSGAMIPDYLYPGSDTIYDVAWFNGNNTPNGTKPVRTKSANKLSLFDMSGNVLEWCWDWYGTNYYGVSPSSNPHGPSNGTNRLLRGGNWSSNANHCRVSYRVSDLPYTSSILYGFRLCRSAI